VGFHPRSLLEPRTTTRRSTRLGADWSAPIRSVARNIQRHAGLSNSSSLTVQKSDSDRSVTGMPRSAGRHGGRKRAHEHAGEARPAHSLWTCSRLVRLVVHMCLVGLVGAAPRSGAHGRAGAPAGRDSCGLVSRESGHRGRGGTGHGLTPASAPARPRRSAPSLMGQETRSWSNPAKDHADQHSQGPSH